MDAKQNKALTLQQKFVKLREAVPKITQQKHSDGVKYKFAKLFDVYELLTPAMNEYGVNFDIVAETATRHRENGDAEYFTSYTQTTRNGPRTVWLYEADITIRWTNADDPADIQDVTLHAIGTNDGGPDKAKGSAWTYCLKYYFFEKFGIDQGDDDPDMKDLSGNNEPQNAQKPPENATKPTGKENTQGQGQKGQDGAKTGQKPLSEAQMLRMYKKGEAVGVTPDEIDLWIYKNFAIQTPNTMTREQYDTVCAALDAQGGQNNA